MLDAEQLPDRTVEDRLQHHGGAGRVGSRVLGELVHALPDADARREVDDRVDTPQRLAHDAGVAHVSDDELHVRIEVRRPRVRPVHLLDEAVEGADAVAVRKELVRQVRPDEAGAASDQDQLSQIASSN